MLNVGIIGAGDGGTSIMKTLISVSEVEIIGICDKDMDAPGIKLAKENNISVYDDFERLLNKTKNKIILEVTGNEKLSKIIKEKADDNTKVVDFETSLVIFKIVNSREKVLNQIEDEADNLAELAADIGKTIENISEINSENIKELNNTAENLVKASENSRENLEETNQIVNFIKEVAEQTKMLGLNAAIEAARADQNTSGFNVVANEIRKLADKTSDSVKEITGFINKLNKSTEKTRKNIDKMNKRTESFNENEEKITEKLHSVADKIHNMADSLCLLSK